MKNKHICIVLVVVSVIMACLSGCGKDTKELDAYYENMTEFTANLTSIKESMEAVDTSSEDATAQILACLDELQEQFRVLSEIEVPKQFESNEDLADEAYSYMQTAVEGFHDYYDDPESDYSAFEVACENYERAMKRVNYISSILKGEVPEGEDVEVIDGDDTDFTPVTEESVE